MTNQRLKQLGVDVLGVMLIIGAGITAPIPGPGGIPLLVLGLSLLATNHEWAARWLKTVKERGLNISDKIFVENSLAKWLIDLAAIVFITLAVLIFIYVTKSIFKTSAISLTFVGLFLLLGNRQRLKNLKKRFKQKIT